MSTKPASLFVEKTAIPNLQSTTKLEVISELVDCLVGAGSVPAAKREALVKALKEREKLGSTGVGGGVASPHVKLDFLKATAGAVGVSRAGINYAAVDGELVHVVFMIVSPTDKATEHLGVLQWISRLARHRDFVRFMKATTEPGDILGLLEELG